MNALTMHYLRDIMHLQSKIHGRKALTMKTEAAEEKEMTIVEEIVENATKLPLPHQEALLMLAKGMVQVHNDKEEELTN